MQRNDKKNNESSGYRYGWDSAIGGVTAFLSYSSGLMGGSHIYMPLPPFMQAAVAASFAGLSVYGARRIGLIHNKNESNPRNTAEASAAFAAFMAGTSCFAGWVSVRYNGEMMCVQGPGRITEATFHKRLRLTAATLVTVGIVSPYLFQKAYDYCAAFDKSKMQGYSAFNLFRKKPELKNEQTEPAQKSDQTQRPK